MGCKRGIFGAELSDRFGPTPSDGNNAVSATVKLVCSFCQNKLRLLGSHRSFATSPEIAPPYRNPETTTGSEIPRMETGPMFSKWS